MAAGNRPDDEDTREHPTGARYPDAPPADAGSARADIDADATVVGGKPPEPWPQPEGPRGEQAAPRVEGWPPAAHGAPGEGRGQSPAQSGPSKPATQWAPPSQSGQWQQPAAQWPAGQGQSPPQQGQWQPPAGQWQPPPGQWAGQPGWGPPPAQWQPEYATSPMVAIAGIVLLVFGLFVTLFGVAGLALGSLIDDVLLEIGPIDTAGFDPTVIAGVVVVVFGVVLVIGILHLISSIGVFVHKQWARIVAIVLSILGTLLGVLSVVGAIDARVQAEGAGLGVALVIAVGYGFSLFALVAGGNHFQRRYRR